jgi:hypothetical protein
MCISSDEYSAELRRLCAVMSADFHAERPFNLAEMAGTPFRNTQNYSVLTTFRKLDLFPSLVGGTTPTQLGPLQKADFSCTSTPVRFTTAI